jgi:8-oxo-dGTP pyrophosphatase MutT (NUDIX family)
MKRNHLLQLLKDYIPTEEEINAKARIIEFIRSNQYCFERSLSIGHITASAWLLNKKGDKALLTHHRKLDAWLQLGGHCDGDPDVLAVAIKEAQEESGIQTVVPVMNSIFDVDVHSIPANSKEAAHYHYDIRFLLQARDNDEIVQNHESNELRWIDKDVRSFPTKARSVVRMFEKWVKLTQPIATL